MSHRRREIRSAFVDRINLVAQLEGRAFHDDGRSVSDEDLPICKIGMFGLGEDVRVHGLKFGAGRIVERIANVEVRLYCKALVRPVDMADEFAAQIETALLAESVPLGGLVNDLRINKTSTREDSSTASQIVELLMLFECSYFEKTS
jgi:hypothetical protein